MILGIESSCDDTAAAILSQGRILSSIVESQLIHTEHGGIVPELASREHLRSINGVVNKAIVQAGIAVTDIKAIAVTSGPGLAGALLTGVHYAKGLASRLSIPVIPVNHIEAHAYSGFIQYSDAKYPVLSLVASGGHTLLFLITATDTCEIVGSTRDDAAGEAFDKTARLLGLEYPGGKHIDRLAGDGDPRKIDFPRGLINHSSFDFSFSGLKTSVRRFLEVNPDYSLPDVCAGVQEAIVDVLVKKSLRAASFYNARTISISGGVSANSRLRDVFTTACREAEIACIIPDTEYCVDNAVMIANLVWIRYGTTQTYLNIQAFTTKPNAIRHGGTKQ